MNRFLRVFTITLLSLTASLMAADFDEMVIFGTSFYSVGDPPPPINPGGKLWENYLAGSLKIPGPTPAGSGGTDYSLVNNTSAQTLADVQAYVMGQPKINDQQLYVVYVGFMDMVTQLAGSGGSSGITPQLTSIASANDVQSVLTLFVAGAKYILLPNQANYSLCPGISSSPPGTKEVVQSALISLNAQTTATLNTLDANVIQLDFFGLTNDIVTDQIGFGFTNVADGAESGGDPSTYLFWDSINFTGAGNQVFSDYALSVLQGPACFAALSELPLSILQTQNLNIFNQLSPLRPENPCGGLSVFISGNYAPLIVGYLSDNHNDSWDWNATGGLTYDWGETTFGAAYGYSKTESGWKHSDGDFEIKSNTVSLFASYHQRDVYVNIIGNYTWLDFSIHRHFNLRVKPFDVKGNPDGHQWGAAINSAYYLGQNNLWKTGPIFNLEYQRVKVDGYEEVGGGSANLFYEDTERSSFITAIGWQLTGGYSTDTILNIYAAYNRDWVNSEKKINFGVLSLESEAYMKIDTPYANFASFGFALSHTFESKLQGDFSYNARVGSPNLNTQVVLIGLSYPIPW